MLVVGFLIARGDRLNELFLISAIMRLSVLVLIARMCSHLLRVNLKCRWAVVFGDG